MLCYCGSGSPFDSCCQPLLNGDYQAPNAERLMRSRYSAHILVNVDYLIKTTAEESRDLYDSTSIENFASHHQWLGLSIIATRQGHKRATVEFVARYQDGQGESFEHHELSTFVKKQNRWYYLSAEYPES